MACQRQRTLRGVTAKCRAAGALTLPWVRAFLLALLSSHWVLAGFAGGARVGLGIAVGVDARVIPPPPSPQTPREINLDPLTVILFSCDIILG